MPIGPAVSRRCCWGELRWSRIARWRWSWCARNPYPRPSRTRCSCRLCKPCKRRARPAIGPNRNIPWRNGRWVPEALDNALIVEGRARNALENYRSYGGSRCLAFCCSVRHAQFMAGFFSDQGVRAAAVFSGPSSAPRTETLERLARGELEVLCCVDIFNEGLDLPAVDTVLMLRPTESRIVWQQQFGRGLRQSEGKSHLKVIDYIGNHRTFLLKPLTLFNLGPGDEELASCFELLRSGRVAPAAARLRGDLQSGGVAPDAGAAPPKPGSGAESYYQEFCEIHGRRPLAVEAHQDRYSPRSTRGWLALVRASTR